MHLLEKIKQQQVSFRALNDC